MFTIRQVLKDCEFTWNDVRCPLSKTKCEKDAHDDDGGVNQIMDIEVSFPQLTAIMRNTYHTDIVLFQVLFKDYKEIEMAHTVSDYIAKNFNVVESPKLILKLCSGVKQPDKLEFLLAIDDRYKICVLFMHLNRYPIVYSDEHIL
jgi:hypothetical protein